VDKGTISAPKNISQVLSVGNIAQVGQSLFFQKNASNTIDGALFTGDVLSFRSPNTSSNITSSSFGVYEADDSIAIDPRVIVLSKPGGSITINTPELLSGAQEVYFQDAAGIIALKSDIKKPDWNALSGSAGEILNKPNFTTPTLQQVTNLSNSTTNGIGYINSNNFTSYIVANSWTDKNTWFRLPYVGGDTKETAINLLTYADLPPPQTLTNVLALGNTTGNSIFVEGQRFKSSITPYYGFRVEQNNDQFIETTMEADKIYVTNHDEAVIINNKGFRAIDGNTLVQTNYNFNKTRGGTRIIATEDQIPNFTNLTVFPDNTSARAGGIAVGKFYRTATGQLMITF
jgi:hypothetical protein